MVVLKQIIKNVEKVSSDNKNNLKNLYNIDQDKNDNGDKEEIVEEKNNKIFNNNIKNYLILKSTYFSLQSHPLDLSYNTIKG